MSETTTVPSKAAEKAVKAATTVSQSLPTVVETAEIALEVPAKVVLNQRLVVVVSVLGGTALGAGALWGVNKLRERQAAKKREQLVDEVLNEDVKKA